ncbi:MAG: type II 3-dehydroquinate dehydratase [Kiritimatiellia bacterium]|jgi:chorismate mutase/prephenate dehydratase
MPKKTTPPTADGKQKTKTVLLINGPNLDKLGQRDPAQYGSFTLADVEAAFIEKAEALGVAAQCFQSNHEGALIEAVHGAMGRVDGIVINAGAYTHTSYALLDAIALTKIPTMEVHISDIHRREAFRAFSAIQPACVGQVSGLGLDSYLVGLERLVKEHLHAAPGEAKPAPAATGLGSLRHSISEIDRQLVRLFERRMRIVEQIAAEKALSGALVHDPSREAKVCEQARAATPGYSDAAESLMRTVMRLSRERQYELLLSQRRHQTATAVLPTSADGTLDFIEKVSFGGTAGSYSEQAAKALFPQAERVPAWSFADACEQVLEGAMDAVVLPLANTSAGPVETVYRLLQQRLFIVRCIDLPVAHRLAVLPGTALEDVKTVLSHPQALAQCSTAIRSHGWQTVPVENTAYAPREVARRADKAVAAICSEEAAALNGLDARPETICDTTCNMTRFIAVTRQLVVTPDASRLGIVLQLPHRTGALAEALNVLADRKLNLAAISSQPVAEKPWEYAFFIDILAPGLDPSALSAICQLSYELPRLQIIGWYGEASGKPLAVRG